LTDYVVLKKDGSGFWSLVSGMDVKARSARSAIREAADRDGEGEYVAIPYRSWRPVSVKVETKTALRFS
jgi:hypothetical protein